MRGMNVVNDSFDVDKSVIELVMNDDFSKKKVIWDNVVVAYLLGMTDHVDYGRPAVKDGHQ